MPYLEADAYNSSFEAFLLTKTKVLQPNSTSIMQHEKNVTRVFERTASLSKAFIACMNEQSSTDGWERTALKVNLSPGLVRSPEVQMDRKAVQPQATPSQTLAYEHNSGSP